MPVITKEVKWGEDNSLDAVPELTEEDKHALEEKKKVLDKLLANKKLAKYKIELFFSHKRSVHAPFAGMLSIWESGTKFHGGGDTKVYECPGAMRGENNCRGFIPDSSTGYGYLVCPSCKKVWQGEQVVGERGAKLRVQQWATLVHRYFMRLDCNADIYVKVPKEDIRIAAELEQNKQMGGEVLNRVRSKKDVFIYPLRNIIKDTASGADLYQRFLAFLSS